MLDPQHNCSWTASRKVNLRLADARFAAAGASPYVLIPALIEPGLVWYSALVEYNVQMVAIRATDAHRSLQKRHREEEPINSRLGDHMQVEEYVLTDAVARQCGLADQFQLDQTTLAPTVCYYASFHDECFSLIYPVQPELLARLLGQVLQLQAFYLGRAFALGSVDQELIKLLKAYGEIEVRAVGHGQQAQINVSVLTRHWAEKIWPGLGLRQIGYISYDGPEAVFHQRT